MVFPSIPTHLDPSNWQQQPNHHHHHHQQQQQQHGVGGGGVSSQLLPPAPPPPPPPPRPLPQPHGSGGGARSIRPGSMADRARMANIPMPETQLKCPRCESSNTIFSFFNNYSLTQPRHFCKTCRRYWTRGGALRNVPVGGGCRRNKRSKGSGSSNKSPATSSDRQTASGASSSTLSSNSGPPTSDMLLGLGPQIPPLRFMAPLHNFNEFASSDHMGLNYPGLSCGPIGGSGSDLSFQIGTALAGLGDEFASSDHMGLNYPGLSCGPIGGSGSDLSFQIGTALAGLGDEFASSDHMGLNYPGLSCATIGGSGSDLSFQIGTALAGLGGGGGGAGGSSLFGGGLEQWRNIQQGGGANQFPFLGGLDLTSSGLYPFESGAESSGYGIGLAGSIATQLASVKMEDSNQDRMNLSRQLLGINANNPVVAGNESTTPQYWSGPAWSTDLSSFSSSSTSNQL